MNLLKSEIFLTLLTTFFISSESYKILAVFPTLWKSHWKIGVSVIKQLAEAGHDVTLVSPFEFKANNIRNVILTNYPTVSTNAFEIGKMPTVMNFVLLPQILENTIDFTLSHENLQKLMNEKFDAVVVEVFHSEALLGLGSHFNCPVIGITTFGTSSYSNIMTGSPNPTSYVPNVFLKYTDDMNFLQRFHNTLMWNIDELFLYFYHYPKQRVLYEKHFPNAKPFEIQRKNIALLFNNNHFASSIVKPSMPSVVDIGGVHIDPAKQLPKDIQEFLDSAKDGAILFSMGSIVQAVQWPEEKREAFVKVFGKLKQKVLWKYENETLPNKPDNVMISPWIPQRDILAHPNIKLFITHGGLLGTTEALVEGVPVLGIPIFGDQKMNMNIAVSKGYASMITFDDVSEESLKTELENILSNREISTRAKEISRIYNDRPLSPQKSVVYWFEYVLRHKRMSVLKTAGLNLSYIEFHSIDVYASFIALTVLILMIFKLLMRLFLKKFMKLIGLSKGEQKLKLN